MNQDNKLGPKIKWQVSRFTSRLCEGMDKLTRRFVGEMLYGIQAAKDVKVSEVARSLNEPIRLIQTENRLYRNLADKDLTGPTNRWTCWEGSGEVDDKTMLATDLGDVRVGSYTALRNTYALAHAVLYFVSVVIGAKAKMNLIFKKVCEKAKRFYEVATFYQYAVAYGIYRLLFVSRTGAQMPPPPKRNGQLVLAFLKPPP